MSLDFLVLFTLMSICACAVRLCYAPVLCWHYASITQTLAFVAVSVALVQYPVNIGPFTCDSHVFIRVKIFWWLRTSKGYWIASVPSWLVDMSIRCCSALLHRSGSMGMFTVPWTASTSTAPTSDPNDPRFYHGNHNFLQHQGLLLLITACNVHSLDESSELCRLHRLKCLTSHRKPFSSQNDDEINICLLRIW